MPKLFVFVSPAFYRLSTDHRRHDVHVLCGDVTYNVRNAHWRVNNKIKRKFKKTKTKKNYPFSVANIKIFISCNENIQIFTRASHSWKYWCFHYTRWQYSWYSQQKSKYALCIFCADATRKHRNLYIVALTLKRNVENLYILRWR